MTEPRAAFRAGFVSLLGWTNVGKSSLLNRFVGTKLAAVSDAAQTTRHRITGACLLEGRAQVIFVDTPGLHRPRHRMNREMVEIARRAMSGVDLALLVVDASRGLGPGDEEAARLLERSGTQRLLVLNKIDLVRPKTELLPMMQTAVDEWGFAEVVPVSARTGEGCDVLLDRVVEALPESPPLFPDEFLTDQPERMLVAEWIREKILEQTRQELPHATAVLVDSWNEREDGLVEIEATVLVDRESQKKIVIGKQGGLLKRVGTAARQVIEEHLERRVFLRLWVKVREGWREDRGVLREIGLE